MTHKNYDFQVESPINFGLLTFSGGAAISLISGVSYCYFNDKDIISTSIKLYSPYGVIAGLTICSAILLSYIIKQSWKKYFPVSLVTHRQLDIIFFHLGIVLIQEDMFARLIYPNVQKDKRGFKIEALPGLVDKTIVAKKDINNYFAQKKASIRVSDAYAGLDGWVHFIIEEDFHQEQLEEE